MKANKIVNERSEEQERKYGPFSAGMEKAARIATELCNKEIKPEDMFFCMMALKLSRLANSIEFDSIVDLDGYSEGLWNYVKEKAQSIPELKIVISDEKDSNKV